MSVVLLHQGPTITRENYEATVEKITGGKSRMESLPIGPLTGF